MLKHLITSTLLCFAFACGGTEADLEDSDDALAIGIGVTGGTCHVVSGPNSGKTGTYDDEGACCDEAKWGCTECSGSNTGKCADGPAPRTTRPRAAVGGVVGTGVLSGGR